MIDRKQDPSHDEEDVAERKPEPELEPETVKDLTPEDPEDVKGGETGGVCRYSDCEAGTA